MPKSQKGGIIIVGSKFSTPIKEDSVRVCACVLTGVYISMKYLMKSTLKVFLMMYMVYSSLYLHLFFAGFLSLHFNILCAHLTLILPIISQQATVYLSKKT